MYEYRTRIETELSAYQWIQWRPRLGFLTLGWVKYCASPSYRGEKNANFNRIHANLVSQIPALLTSQMPTNGRFERERVQRAHATQQAIASAQWLWRMRASREGQTGILCGAVNIKDDRRREWVATCIKLLWVMKELRRLSRYRRFLGTMPREIRNRSQHQEELDELEEEVWAWFAN